MSDVAAQPPDEAWALNCHTPHLPPPRPGGGRGVVVDAAWLGSARAGADLPCPPGIAWPCRLLRCDSLPSQ